MDETKSSMADFNVISNESSKQRYRLPRLAVAVLFVLMMASYEFLIAFSRLIDGEWAQRETIWHGWGMGCPFPYQRGTVYTYYEDDQGQEIRHGEFRRLHSNGVVSYRAIYRHGEFEGVVSEWNHIGLKTNETIYSNGKRLGWAVYQNGTLHYHNERLLQDGRSIASKRFENGLWFLEFHSGETPIWQIDSSTGEVSRLN
jgi:hypothetical protein